jgi:hypothetical protein
MKQLPAFFYSLSSGREPVREWLKGLSAADRKIVGEDIKGCRVRMADWYAALPVPGSRVVGGSQHIDARADRPRTVL